MLNPHIVPTLVELLRDEFPDQAAKPVLDRLDEILSTAVSNDDTQLVQPDGKLIRMFPERRTPDLPKNFYATVGAVDYAKR